MKQISKIALGVLALIAGLNSAQAVTMASGTAALSNLKITLVDLDPNDGIAPSVTFAPGTLTTGYMLNEGDSVTENALPIGNTFNTTASGKNGLLSYEFAPNGIKLTASLDSADFTNAGFTSPDQSYYSAGGWGYATYANAFNPDSPDFSSFTQFTLSANTALIVSGTASTSVKIANEAEVAAIATPYFDPTKADLTQISTNGAAMARVSLQFASADAWNWGYSAPNTTNTNVLREVNVDQYYGIYEGEDSGAFALSFANGGAESLQANMIFSIEVNGGAVGYAPALVVPELPEVPTIPEPSTYLLMGLGLAGIGLACSRQRAKQAAAEA